MEEITEKPQEITYEQLKEVAEQLANQNNALRQKLNEVNDQLSLARLSFLFKVLECKESFSESFIRYCVNEIEYTMTIPTEPDKPEEDTKENTEK